MKTKLAILAGAILIGSVVTAPGALAERFSQVSAPSVYREGATSYDDLWMGFTTGTGAADSRNCTSNASFCASGFTQFIASDGFGVYYGTYMVGFGRVYGWCHRPAGPTQFSTSYWQSLVHDQGGTYTHSTFEAQASVGTECEIELEVPA